MPSARAGGDARRASPFNFLGTGARFALYMAGLVCSTRTQMLTSNSPQLSLSQEREVLTHTSRKVDVRLGLSAPCFLAGRHCVLISFLMIALLSFTPAFAYPFACTEEEKLCADGSSVSRMRPDCEFAASPSSPSNALSPNIHPVSTGRIEGQIVLYPASGVERADTPNWRGIPGQVTVTDAGGSVVAQVSSDARGLFNFDLPPGRYTLRLMSVRPPGHAEPVPVTVDVGQVTKTVITFDAGIR